ncbi:MAG: phosphomannomutase/phosphoglucomutase, partial [Clostridia bacterium]|nr:phosphomannomutase/phosphoglucomutase [Clostridia bacterium]
MTLMHLKSGSDIRGAAWELSSDVVVAVVNGYLDLMSEDTGKDTSDMKISVGMDPRLSSPSIYAVVIESMVSAGVKVMECGLCSTPAMFMTTVTHDCDGAVMV